MFLELLRALNSKQNYLYFMPTSRCNAACEFCWNWENVEDAKKTKRDELALEEIEALTKKLPPMLLVNFIGGEPFVRKEIEEIMELFIVNANALYISMPTNGYYTQKTISTFEKLTRKFPNTYFRINISIDGPSAVHEKVRKLKGGYQKALDTAFGLAKLRDRVKNFALACNANYNSDTMDTMGQHIEEMMSLNIFDSINMNYIRGKPKDPKLSNANPNEFFRLQKIIEKYRCKSSQPFSPLHKAVETRSANMIRNLIISGTSRREWNCFALRKIVVLDDVGNVYPCEEMISEPVGNIRNFNYSLSDLVGSAAGRKTIGHIVDKKCSCRWECGITTSGIFDIKEYPSLLKETAKNIFIERFR